MILSLCEITLRLAPKIWLAGKDMPNSNELPARYVQLRVCHLLIRVPYGQAAIYIADGVLRCIIGYSSQPQNQETCLL